ncbi:MAG: hypothetical protein NZ578_11670 [Candidatus Binatia bacterium]|nr:hypothetical protein [Candidatus Binatia bacterium]
MTEAHRTHATGAPSSAEGHRQPQSYHESYAVDIRPLVLFGLGLAVLVVVSALLMAWLFGYFGERQVRQEAPTSLFREERQPPPAPRLQVDPPADLRRLRAAEDAVLQSYGWVDRDAGIVRIPIDRAIALLAERGLPARSEAADPEGRQR